MKQFFIKYKFAFAFSFAFVLLYFIQFETFESIDFSDIRYHFKTKVEEVVLYDPTRKRKIPIAIYKADTRLKIKNQPIIVFSHGYGKNKKRSYLAYSDINKHLASLGYIVLSIQHEQAYDQLLPMIGNMQIMRLPFWIRGTRNISYVVEYLLNSKFNNHWDEGKLILIGHSNGGDISAYFSKIYPSKVGLLITLDNLRVSLPLQKTIKVASLRGGNHQPDIGVIPNDSICKEFGIEIFYLNIKHDNFSNLSTSTEEKKINTILDNILKTYQISKYSK